MILAWARLESLVVESTSQTPILCLPGCKSASARALLLAACASGRSCLQGLSDSQDTGHIRQAIRILGAKVSDGKCCEIDGFSGAPPGGQILVDAGEAATNLRLLLALAAISPGGFSIAASAGLKARPHQAILDFLIDIGQEVRVAENYQVGPWVIPGGDWICEAGASSQFHSGLALAAVCRAEGEVVDLHLPANLPSRGYLNLTIELIKSFCGDAVLSESPQRIELLAGPPKGQTWNCPADASSASFFLVRSLLCNSSIKFLRPWSATHPEAEFSRWLIGNSLIASTDQLLFEPSLGHLELNSSRIPQLSFDIDPCPDVAPAISVLAAHLVNGILLSGTERLRFKESDRFNGMRRLVAALGGEFEQQANGQVLIRRGHGQRSGIAVACASDHRLAMAAAIADLEVDNRECVAKSFPNFWQELAKC